MSSNHIARLRPAGRLHFSNYTGLEKLLRKLRETGSTKQSTWFRLLL